MYQVKIQQFIGPLDKLLELIENKKLEITEISLAEVTNDFLKYIEELGEKITSRILADFLVIAAKLILIKSKTLLPNLELTQEEEIEIQDLEQRLKIYKEFKKASQYIQNLWLKNQPAFSREFLAFYNSHNAVFYPPQKLVIGDLIKAAEKLLSSLKLLLPESIKITKKKIISLESEIRELINRFRENSEQSFKKIALGRDKKEIIVAFLAILHLLKERIIQVEQKNQFSDIILKKI